MSHALDYSRIVGLSVAGACFNVDSRSISVGENIDPLFLRSSYQSDRHV